MRADWPGSLQRLSSSETLATVLQQTTFLHFGNNVHHTLSCIQTAFKLQVQTEAETSFLGHSDSLAPRRLFSLTSLLHSTNVSAQCTDLPPTIVVLTQAADREARSRPAEEIEFQMHSI